VKEGSTTIATFEYDGFGRRTEKVAAGGTHQYIYDAEDIVEERISGSTTDTIRYYHGAGIDEPLARQNSSSVVTYYLADHLGSIVQETNASGAVTLEREFDAWGETVQGGTASGYSFTGREWDAETGLYYYRTRYYSPKAAPFINEDTVGLLGGNNLYAYVNSRPSVSKDPNGTNPLLLALPWLVEGAGWAVVESVVVVVGIYELLNQQSKAIDTFPEPDSVPDWWVKHPKQPPAGTGYGDRWVDVENDEVWTWHDDVDHGPPHWDIGHRKTGKQEWWPRGGPRGPKPPGKQRPPRVPAGYSPSERSKSPNSCPK
jgi:RHS repeat-associated protein